MTTHATAMGIRWQEEIETLELVVGNGLIRNCTRRADRFTGCERKIDRHETLVSGGM